MRLVLAALIACVCACSSESGVVRQVNHAGMVPIDVGRSTFLWVDAHEVTNAEFAAFVDATRYRTDAERIGDSVVFVYDFYEDEGKPWRLIEGADWRHPDGPSSMIETRMDHPVVHVSWNDAAAYAQWVGKRLPTGAEWEHAARGGLPNAAFPWGDELVPGGVFQANYWQGSFPSLDRGDDGFRGTSPVGSFPANGHGLFDMGGNVWEWTADESLNSEGLPVRPTRGGSYLCRDNADWGYHRCEGYRVESIQLKILEDSNSNVGFRCVSDR